MDVRIYEVFLQFNQGLDQALRSLDILEELDLESPSCITKIRVNLSELRSYANNCFASKIAQKEQDEGNNFYRIRRNREKAEEGPNEIYLELKSREALRREQGLLPRAVILPWTRADDDRILAMQKAASSSLPTQPEQARTIGASEQGQPKRRYADVKQTAYELLALLDRNLRESVNLFKQLAECPGQRSDVLTPLSNEIQYVQDQAKQWSRIRHKYERWLKDADDVFLDAEERDEQRKKQGLPPRIVVLPWSAEEEEKLLAAKRAQAAKKRKATRKRTASPKEVVERKKK